MLRLLTVTALFTAGLAGTSLAQEPGLDAILACRTIDAPLERVSCYDAATGRLEEARASGEVRILTKADVEKVQRESFGFRIPSLPSFSRQDGADENKLESITEAISSVTVPNGKVRVTLANGQVWVQIDDKRVRVRNPQSAEVFQAALGSYKMKLDDGLAFRVRREN